MKLDKRFTWKGFSSGHGLFHAFSPPCSDWRARHHAAFRSSPFSPQSCLTLGKLSRNSAMRYGLEFKMWLPCRRCDFLIVSLCPCENESRGACRQYLPVCDPRRVCTKQPCILDKTEGTSACITHGHTCARTHHSGR